MKKLLILLTIAILFLNFGAAQIFAQEKTQEFIIVKMIIRKEIFEHQFRIPIRKSFDDGELTGGGFATVDCANCLLTGRYEFYGFAESVNQNKSRVSFTAKFDNQKSCGFDAKIFIAYRNKITKLKLKCGIEIVAFFENKTTSD